MSVRLLYIFIFLCVGRLCIGQISYDDETLRRFVSVYMDSKIRNSNTETEKKVQSLLKKHDLSTEQYRTLSKERVLRSKPRLTPKETQLISDIQKLEYQYQQDRSDRLSRSCEARSIELDTYLAIRSSYKTDISFQRSLQPFFKEYINQKKK